MGWTLSATIDAKLAKNVLAAIAISNREPIFKVTPEGISGQCADPANVMMCLFTIPSSLFSSYKAEETEFVVDLPTLQSAIKGAKETIDFVLDPETQTLNLNFGNISRGIKLLDPASTSVSSYIPRVPDLSYEKKIVAKSSDISDGVKAIVDVADILTISSEDSLAFCMSAKSDLENITVDISKDDLIDITPGAAKTMYSCDYLSDIATHASKLAMFCTIEFSTDYPITLCFDFIGNGYLKYLVAPRIEA